MKLVIDTYENNDTAPILTHVFHGKTAAEINSVVKAHMGTDSFFKASMTTGNFKGIRLTNRTRWTK